MAVGKPTFPTMYPVPGFKLGTTSAGIKTPGRKDLVVMEIAPGSTVAGVFTKNAFCAAPVQIAKAHLAQTAPRYLVTNTGNANAGTGEQGMADANAICQALADAAGVSQAEVLPFSTGVIGEPLPAGKIIAVLPQALAALTEQGWADAGEGILTTDTRPKGASCQLDIEGKTVTITGISKGSGMIKPNMATMLGYIATDAQIDQPLLQQLVTECCDSSFNRITVDGDTSTNDSVIVAATGQSGVSIGEKSAGYNTFVAALRQVAVELAQAIVRDGEGASKFVTVAVTGAASQQEALDVAFTVAESPLVKTALFASDPNWGRILAAVGRAGVEGMDVDKVVVHLGDVLLTENGGRASGYSEEAGQAVMDREEIDIHINLGRGDCSETVWTTDLSHEYVRINAEYRT
ncbi:bifunctional glutamate N-acetyltransferase/amino-acid acetyltransferase ArgJ [Porticoccus sp. W117]|uniref:bifunctional glutamate N-acetyltransferase/amino-acid acetyltransferase ArgJ n=1 Tax=Porticoccus sp. W117 TaxID=3054777 RepID=UPI002599CE3B|nr:bifunctional glutamate N-acetyltransferase/amino-acid acetyltransferase ArgJ [Porticoccus sp. W117]MDM3871763.1 bifunctional glutamate N-acetyltransferase/amino-acid acetyltransferase ArgJ [Porticoccus sp. W117]